MTHYVLWINCFLIDQTVQKAYSYSEILDNLQSAKPSNLEFPVISLIYLCYKKFNESIVAVLVPSF